MLTEHQEMFETKSAAWHDTFIIFGDSVDVVKCLDRDCLSCSGQHYHCPYCASSLVFTNQKDVLTHLDLQHWPSGVQFKDLLIVSCSQTCSEAVQTTSHYHCPLCPALVEGQSHFLAHLQHHLKEKNEEAEFAYIPDREHPPSMFYQDDTIELCEDDCDIEGDLPNDSEETRKGHFHCPACKQVKRNKTTMVIHLRQCTCLHYRHSLKTATTSTPILPRGINKLPQNPKEVFPMWQRSIVRTLFDIPLRRCPTLRCCKKHYHCPLCVHIDGQGMEAVDIREHFKIHVSQAISYNGYIYLGCHLDCGNGSRTPLHYHCGYCGLTEKDKKHFYLHLKLCRRSSGSQPQNETLSPQTKKTGNSLPIPRERISQTIVSNSRESVDIARRFEELSWQNDDEDHSGETEMVPSSSNPAVNGEFGKPLFITPKESDHIDSLQIEKREESFHRRLVQKVIDKVQPEKPNTSTVPEYSGFQMFRSVTATFSPPFMKAFDFSSKEAAEELFTKVVGASSVTFLSSPGIDPENPVFSLQGSLKGVLESEEALYKELKEKNGSDAAKLLKPYLSDCKRFVKQRTVSTYVNLPDKVPSVQQILISNTMPVLSNLLNTSTQPGVAQLLVRNPQFVPIKPVSVSESVSQSSTTAPTHENIKLKKSDTSLPKKEIDLTKNCKVLMPGDCGKQNSSLKQNELLNQNSRATESSAPTKENLKTNSVAQTTNFATTKHFTSVNVPGVPGVIDSVYQKQSDSIVKPCPREPTVAKENLKTKSVSQTTNITTTKHFTSVKVPGVPGVHSVIDLVYQNQSDLIVKPCPREPTVAKEKTAQIATIKCLSNLEVNVTELKSKELDNMAISKEISTFSKDLDYSSEGKGVFPAKHATETDNSLIPKPCCDKEPFVKLDVHKPKSLAHSKAPSDSSASKAAPPEVTENVSSDIEMVEHSDSSDSEDQIQTESNATRNVLVKPSTPDKMALPKTQTTLANQYPRMQTRHGKRSANGCEEMERKKSRDHEQCSPGVETRRRKRRCDIQEQTPICKKRGSPSKPNTMSLSKIQTKKMKVPEGNCSTKSLGTDVEKMQTRSFKVIETASKKLSQDLDKNINSSQKSSGIAETENGSARKQTLSKSVEIMVLPKSFQSHNTVQASSSKQSPGKYLPRPNILSKSNNADKIPTNTSETSHSVAKKATNGHLLSTVSCGNNTSNGVEKSNQFPIEESMQNTVSVKFGTTLFTSALTDSTPNTVSIIQPQTETTVTKSSLAGVPKAVTTSLAAEANFPGQKFLAIPIPGKGVALVPLKRTPVTMPAAVSSPTIVNSKPVVSTYSVPLATPPLSVRHVHSLSANTTQEVVLNLSNHFNAPVKFIPLLPEPSKNSSSALLLPESSTTASSAPLLPKPSTTASCPLLSKPSATASCPLLPEPSANASSVSLLPEQSGNTSECLKNVLALFLRDKASHSVVSSAVRQPTCTVSSPAAALDSHSSARNGRSASQATHSSARNGRSASQATHSSARNGYSASQEAALDGHSSATKIVAKQSQNVSETPLSMALNNKHTKAAHSVVSSVLHQPTASSSVATLGSRSSATNTLAKRNYVCETPLSTALNKKTTDSNLSKFLKKQSFYVPSIRVNHSLGDMNVVLDRNGSWEKTLRMNGMFDDFAKSIKFHKYPLFENEHTNTVKSDAFRDLGVDSTFGDLGAESTYIVKSPLELLLEEKGPDFLSTFVIKNKELSEFQCPFCSDQLSSTGHLLAHMMTIHIKLNCPECPSVFAKSISLAKHLKRGHISSDKPEQNKSPPTTELRCGECTEVFDSSKLLHDHQSFKHKVKAVCYLCSSSKVYDTYDKLLLHIERDHLESKNGVICDICGESFGFNVFGKHRKTHHRSDRRTFQCATCGKTVKYLNSLKIHQETHKPLEERTFFFTCEYCGKRFRNKTKFTDHVNIKHTRENTYDCEECGKKFNSRSLLSKHKYSAHTIREFKCKICDRAFKFKTAVRSHMVVHTQISKHTCPMCSRPFGQSGALKSHIERCERNNGLGTWRPVRKKEDKEANSSNKDKLANSSTKDKLANSLTKDKLANSSTKDKKANSTTIDKTAYSSTIDKTAYSSTIDKKANSTSTFNDRKKAMLHSGSIAVQEAAELDFGEETLEIDDFEDCVDDDNSNPQDYVYMCSACNTPFPDLNSAEKHIRNCVV